MGCQQKTEIRPPFARFGAVVAWVGIVLLGWILLATSFLEQPVLARHHQTVDIKPDSCSIEESAHALIRPDQLTDADQWVREHYSWFYVCSKTAITTLTSISYCIPFTKGSSDYTAYSSARGAPSKTQGSGYVAFRQWVPIYRPTLDTTDNRTIDCEASAQALSLNIQCNFDLSSAPPHDEGPLNVASLSYCTLKFTLANPEPSTTYPRVNWGSNRPPGLGPDDPYLVFTKLTNCRDPETGADQGSFQACRLPPINRHSNFDVCWSVAGLDPPQQNFDGFTVGGYPWDSGLRLNDLIKLDNANSNCQTLVSSGDDTPPIIKYYRFSSISLTCTVNPAKNGKLALDHDRVKNDCYLVGLGLTPSVSASQPPGDSWGELPQGEKFEDTIKCVDDCSDFFDTVNSFLSWMAYLVVPIVTIVIIVGAIQLSLAGDNPEGTKKAKARITQAVVALVFYILLWSFLRWILP